jgi:hypothetical protein
MTGNLQHRLDALERTLGATTRSVQDELDWLSEPSLVVAIQDVATSRAERRWCRVRGHPMFNAEDRSRFLNIHWHGWYPHTTDEEREPFILAEVADLDRRIVATGLPCTLPVLLEVIEAWADDEAGLATPIRSEGYPRFLDRLTKDRAHKRAYRTNGTPVSRLWQSQHPEWHPDMDDDELGAWEIAMFNEEARRAIRDTIDERYQDAGARSEPARLGAPCR